MDALTFLTTDSISWPTVYLVLLVSAFGLALLSGDDLKLKAGVLLALAYMSQNYLHDHFGDISPPWIAVADLALGGIAVRIGYSSRSWTLWLVVMLFAMDEAIIWGTQFAGVKPSGIFYAALNLLYLLQLLVVGVSSGMAWGAHRLHRVPARHVAIGR